MTERPRYLASEHGARLDADLRSGGGGDDTAALQAILDRARGGEGVHLVLDGVARTTGLDVYGNTTIEGATDECGLVLADGAERSIIRNAHRTRGEIVDIGITLRRLRFAGNRTGQVAGWHGGPLPGDLGWDLSTTTNVEADRSWKSPVQLLGVRDLVLEGIEIRDASSFSLWLANVSHVEIRDLTIDVGHGPFPADASRAEQIAFLDATPPTLDGIHVNGPADHVLIDGADIRSRDDAVSFCANDWAATDLTLHDLSGPYAGQGPITDVVVRNVHLNSPSHGIRLLSADQRIDRVHIERVTGSVEMRAILISHFVCPQTGDIGEVTIRDVDLRAAPSLSIREWKHELYAARDASPGFFDEEGESAFLVVNAAVESLSLQEATLSDFARRPLLLVGPDATVGRLEVSLETDGATRVEITDDAELAEVHLALRRSED